MSLRARVQRGAGDRRMDVRRTGEEGEIERSEEATSHFVRSFRILSVHFAFCRLRKGVNDAEIEGEG